MSDCIDIEWLSEEVMKENNKSPSTKDNNKITEKHNISKPRISSEEKENNFGIRPELIAVSTENIIEERFNQLKYDPINDKIYTKKENNVIKEKESENDNDFSSFNACDIIKIMYIFHENALFI